MGLIAFGLNHKTAPLAIREQLVFTPEHMPAALRDLTKIHQAANEAVILSTCNRTEIYAIAPEPAILTDWWAQRYSLSPTNLHSHFYLYSDFAAVKHLMRVASGLDSMVLGEPQILGQLKSAYALSQQLGGVGNQLTRLFQTVFTVTKLIRSDTAIGVNPVSIAYTAVNLAKQIFANLANCTVLLIGAGDTIELAATHLTGQGVKRLFIANRTEEKALQLATKFQARSIPLADVPIYLHSADIVITATASPLPILGKGAVESALKLRKNKAMLMLDLAVPRDIEPEVASLEDVYLYNIDDLQKVIADNLKSRMDAATQAEALIDLQAQHFMREMKSLEASDTICAYREKLMHFAEEELNKAQQQLQQGKIPAQVLQQYSHALLQKIMHSPSTQLRQAAYDGQLDLLLLARRLFDL